MTLLHVIGTHLPTNNTLPALLTLHRALLSITPLSLLIANKGFMILEKLAGVYSGLLGVELGLLRLSFIVLTTRPWRYSNCGHPTRAQTQYQTYKVPPY